ncbi:hypothetical protein U9M48_006288 [Paspalum notatum var. saurae]|uniref:Cystatin domain-containing protein n=1 Tax=Paspalum notatum var. saurae TaxID=547442 RepID=A0AAQ3PZH4_PASNO
MVAAAASLMRRSPPALPLLGPALLLLVALSSSSSHADAAWVPVVDVNELVVKQVGQFAVLVYGLAHRKDLVFVGVVRGQTEAAVGGGTNYRLVVAAARPDDGGSTALYDCLVWGVPGSRSDTWKLRRFRKIVVQS